MTKIEDMHQAVKIHLQLLNEGVEFTPEHNTKAILEHLDRLFTYVTNYVERIG